MGRMTWMMTAAAVGLAVIGSQAQTPIKTIEDGALDSIKLYAEKPPTTTKVVIRPFDTTVGDLTEGEKDSEETKQMLKEGPKLITESFVTNMKKLGPFTDASIGESGAGALFVEGKFIEMDPGSMAKRMFIGYGAGKSGVTAKGTVKGPDGKLLAEFQQRRIGTRARGLEMLQNDTKDIGEDLAKFLNKWATGKKLN